MIAELASAVREFTLTLRAMELGIIDPLPSQIRVATAFMRAAAHQLDLAGKIANPETVSELAVGPHGAERDWR